MARPSHWPNPPRWTEEFPCPTSVTLYLSAMSIRRFNKSFPLPPEPDWKKIWQEYEKLNRK